MRRVAISAACIALLGVAPCEEEVHTCTSELRTAVVVRITGGSNLVERVTAQNGRNEYECGDAAGRDHDAGERVSYYCNEGSPGTYTIRIYRENGETLTETVEVSGDECHVDYPPRELEIALPIID